MRTYLSLLTLILAHPAQAQDEAVEPRYHNDELYAERVHSDLPLYDFTWEDFWPRYFFRDQTFGCESRISFGDWEFTPNPVDEYGNGWWLRLSNYGVFHCAAILRQSWERAELAAEPFEYGFFAKIGEVQRSGEVTELWAIQEGFVPGSEYFLLSRSPAEGIVESFSLLQHRCEEGDMRELAGNLDVWSTDYCAINSREDLFALAIDMLELPPLGTLSWRGDSDDAPPALSDEESEAVMQDDTISSEALGDSSQYSNQ